MLESKDVLNIHCRWMVRRDLPEVLDLQKKYCRNYLSEDEHITMLRKRDNIGMVAEDLETGSIKAYMIYQLHEQSLLVLRFVTNVVEPDEAGDALITKLMSKLSFERRKHLHIPVPEDDLEMQLYFKDAGFRCVSIEKGYFDDGMDAYLMQFTLLPNGKTLAGEKDV